MKERLKKGLIRIEGKRPFSVTDFKFVLEKLTEAWKMKRGTRGGQQIIRIKLNGC